MCTNPLVGALAERSEWMPVMSSAVKRLWSFISHNSINSPSSSLRPLSLFFFFTIFVHIWVTLLLYKKPIQNYTEKNKTQGRSFEFLLHVDVTKHQSAGWTSLLTDLWSRRAISAVPEAQCERSSNNQQFQWRCPHRTQWEERLWSKESAALSLFSAARYRFSSRPQTAAAAGKRLLSLPRFAGAAGRWRRKSSFSPWWHKATVSYKNLSK